MVLVIHSFRCNKTKLNFTYIIFKNDVKSLHKKKYFESNSISHGKSGVATTLWAGQCFEGVID